MREMTGTGELVLPADANLVQPLFQHERDNPGRPLLAHRVGSQFVDITAKQFAGKVRSLAKGLIGLDLAPGTRVALMSKTRIEWTYLDYAIWAAGCVTVPIYETSSAEQIEWIVSDSEAQAIFVENAAMREEFQSVADRLPQCKHVFVIDEGGLDELASHGETIDDGKVEDRVAGTNSETLATIVYTSGTTGRPKGCLLTHGNLRWDELQVVNKAKQMFSPGESTLLFLPLAHIFGRLIEVGVIESGAKMGYATDVKQLVEELGIFKPTFLLSVPRVFEKVYNSAVNKANAEGKGKIFQRAVDAAIAFSQQSQAGSVGLGTKLKHGLFDKLVFGKLRHALGGQVRYCISGGAPLGERLGHFFNGIGVTVLEGYGLTETSAGATLNFPGEHKIGSVGRPLPGCSIKIADDGEVLIKGPNVFKGYYNNDAATQEALEPDGWFHSGDIGELDSEGFLRITGRKKDLIVTAGGKNVAPAVLEDRLNANSLISQSMVVGDNRPFVAALITIDPEDFPRWAKENGKEGHKVADLVDDPTLRATIQEAIDGANRAVSKAESIRKFVILPDDFSIETGELTPTLKVKRNVVQEKYGEAIEQLYEGASAAA